MILPTSDKLDTKQFEAVNHLMKANNAIVWWKIGEGKSRIAIHWTYCITRNEPRPLIVCSPGAIRTWEDEIETLGLLGRYKPLFFSYGMLTKGLAGVWELNRQLKLRRFDPNCAIIDELWLYKNPKSKRSGAILGISRAYPTIGLSGSMVTANNVEDLYGQAKAVGLGESIATSLTNFRSQFCISVKGYGNHLVRYPRKGAVETIQKRIKDSVHIWFPKSRIESREIPTKFDPSPIQEKLANNLIKEYYVKQEGFELEVKSKASLIIKLLQISDGFLRSGEGSYISVKSNKLQGLIHNISELLESGERVLVWFAFKRSIKEAVSLSTFPTVVLSGDDVFDVETWKRGKANVCYATVGSGASINDFKDVRYAIIYSSSFSFRALEQAKGRTARKSSNHSVAYYYFYQTVGFPEQYIYESIDMAENTEQTTIRVTNKVIENWLREKAIWDSI